jgi:hypothetical protein
MAVITFTSESDIKKFKEDGGSFAPYDIIKHHPIPAYIATVMLEKYFTGFVFSHVNVGTSLYAMHGHSTIIVI